MGRFHVGQALQSCMAPAPAAYPEPLLSSSRMIKLFVGLGNPGPEYDATRHNAGFWWVDALARELKVSLVLDKSYHGVVARTTVRDVSCTMPFQHVLSHRDGSVCHTEYTRMRGGDANHCGIIGGSPLHAPALSSVLSLSASRGERRWRGALCVSSPPSAAKRGRG